MKALPYICYNTTIYQLIQAGIVPEWMYKDCDIHGINTAEDFLCEQDWDWNWNWDLGKGYSKERLDTLAKACQIVSEAIAEFERNPELQKLERERLKAEKRREELKTTLYQKYKPFFYVGEIPAIVDYVMAHDEEPLFKVFYVWFHRYQHSDKNKVRYLMGGVYDGIEHSPKEIEAMMLNGDLKDKYGIETEFNLRQLQRLAKTPVKIKGKLEYLIPAIRSKLQQEMNSEELATVLNNADHPVWEEIMTREKISFNSALLSQALRYFLR